MNDEDKTKEQLVNGLKELRQRTAGSEASETERKQAEEVLWEREELKTAPGVGTIMVVDDEAQICAMLGEALSGQGYQVTTYSDSRAALRCIRKGRVFDLILADVHMPQVNGLTLLKEVRGRHTETKVILITGFLSSEIPSQAIERGAYTYLYKPFNLPQVLSTVREALEGSSESVSLYGLIGNSACMRQVYEKIRKVAVSDSNVLILGESGTGKELTARTTHRLSSREAQSFIPVNCGALAEGLLENELFGHTKGAYTGAVASKYGLFRAADKGTLFLDEIGNMSPILQAKFLRVLEDGCFRRVGDTKLTQVDVRLISASWMDLRERVDWGAFREDLFFRLNVVEIDLPPLRERREDIPLLVEHFIRKYDQDRGIVDISDSALEVLVQYEWPGNVRELENVIQRALVLMEGNEILTSDLPDYVKVGDGGSWMADGDGSLVSLQELERRYVGRVLRAVDGNRTQAAEILGISTTTLWRKMKQWGVGAGRGGSHFERVLQSAMKG